MASSDRLARSLKGNRRPLYTQAIAALHELLEQGNYKPGDLLPSEDVLAKQLGISRSTLREALGHLETHRLVSRRQGIGTFVGAPVLPEFMGGLERLESFHSIAAAAGLDVEVTERTVSSLPATADLAARLEVEPGAELVRVQVVEVVNGRRCAYLNSYVRGDLVTTEDLANFNGSVIDYFTAQGTGALSHTRSELSAAPADPQLASRLNVPPGQPILHLLEVYYPADEKPIAISLNYFLTEFFRFYLIRRVPHSKGG